MAGGCDERYPLVSMANNGGHGTWASSLRNRLPSEKGGGAEQSLGSSHLWAGDQGGAACDVGENEEGS